MSPSSPITRLLAAALALLLFAGAYVAAFFAWGFLLDAAGDWSLEDTGHSDVVWFVLIASLLWVAVGAVVGRWWVLLVPLVPYLWLRGKELVEFGEVGLGSGASSIEVWLVIAVCALGIGCGLRVWAAKREM